MQAAVLGADELKDSSTVATQNVGDAQLVVAVFDLPQITPACSLGSLGPAECVLLT